MHFIFQLTDDSHVLLWLRMSREEDHAASKASCFFIFNNEKEFDFVHQLIIQ